MKRETVGVLGGTFDPVHLGHLQVAAEVHQAFALTRVLLVPCAMPPHKEARQVTPAVHRLAMLRLATVGMEKSLAISTVEIDRGGTSFTIDTLRALRDERCLDPLFILGMDALLEIQTWRDYGRLLEEFDFVVVDRSSGSIAGARDGLDPKIAARVVPASRGGLPEGAPVSPPEAHGGRVFHLRMEPVPVSSRQIRDLAAAGAPLDGLVPPRVARYIQEQGLYREEGHR